MPPASVRPADRMPAVQWLRGGKGPAGPAGPVSRLGTGFSINATDNPEIPTSKQTRKSIKIIFLGHDDRRGCYQVWRLFTFELRHVFPHLMLTFHSLNLMNESKTRGTSAASPPPPPLGSGSQEADPAPDKHPEDDDAVGIHSFKI